MLQRSARSGLAAAGVSLAALFAAAAPAHAVVTKTNVTTPSSTFITYTDDASENDADYRFTVSGTSDGTTGDAVDIICTYGDQFDEEGYDYSTLLPGVAVNEDGTFSTDAADRPEYTACNGIRAIPANSGYDLADAAKFTGPKGAFGEISLSTNTNDPAETNSVYDHYLNSVTLDNINETYSLGSGGICDNYLLGPNQGYNQGPWDCVGYFWQYDSNVDGAQLKIDGHNAYAPYNARNINNGATGLPNLTISRTFDAATGQFKFVETDPIVFCATAEGEIKDVDGYPSGAACPNFVSAGVTVVRTYAESRLGRTVTFSDAFNSTDAKQHALSAAYENDLNDRSTKFPGETEYAEHDYDAIDLSGSSTGTIYTQTDSDNAPGRNNPQGTLTYTTAPTRAIAENSYFLLQYDRTIPAGGGVTIPQVYSVGFTRSEVQNVVSGTEAPVVKITSPAAGTVVGSDAVTVIGTATDNVGVSKLTVNGIPTPVGDDGSWSQRVSLAPGANTITAIATDGAGQTAQAQTSVVYAPPLAPSCKVPNVVGQSSAAAATAIGGAGCTVGVTTAVASKLAKGSIVSQSRAAGGTLPAYFPIDLKVSSGPVGKAKLKSKTVSIKKGSVKLKVQCPTTSGNVCNGTIKLRTHGKVGGKKRTLGTKAFQTPAGKSRTTTFKLSKGNRKALAGKTTKVDVFIVYRDEDGKSRTTKGSVKIKG